jgi:type IV pilus assembly protein PilV
MRPDPPGQAGFTLVEVLVASIVLTVGLLGLIALQLESLRATRSALARTQAVALTADLADRIRARSTPAAAYDCGGDCDDGDGGDAFAAAELAAWRESVRARLPDGTASVAYEAGAIARYQIVLSWLDAHGSRASHALDVLVGTGGP